VQWDTSGHTNGDVVASAAGEDDVAIASSSSVGSEEGSTKVKEAVF